MGFLLVLLWKGSMEHMLGQTVDVGTSAEYLLRGVAFLACGGVFWLLRGLLGQTRAYMSGGIALVTTILLAVLQGSGGLSHAPAAMQAAVEFLYQFVLAWLYLDWAIIYSRLCIRLIARYIFLVYTAIGFFRLVTGVLPAAALPVVCTVLIVCAGVAELAALRLLACDSGGAEDGPQIQDAGFLLPVAVELALFGLTNGCLSCVTYAAGFDPTFEPSNVVLRALFPLLLFWVFAVRKAQPSPSRILLATVAIMSTLVLCAAFIGSVPSLLGSFVSMMRVTVVILLYFALTCLASAKYRDRPYLAICGGMALYWLACGVGSVVGRALGVTSVSTSLALIIVYALAVVLTLMISFQRRGREIPAGGAGGDDGALRAAAPDLAPDLAEGRAEGRVPAATAQDAHLARIALEAGLTDRETQVLGLFAHGYSKHAIAEQLCVTENTVRGHIKKAYVKLGITSRDELLKLTNNPR